MENEQDSSRWAKTFKDLLIWKRSIELVTNIYKLTAHFPKTETLGIISQLRRASVSIPSNIAEGYGRKSKMDFVRFCQIAMGSLFEVQTQLHISFNLGFISDLDFQKTLDDCREIERMISSFVERLKNNK